MNNVDTLLKKINATIVNPLIGVMIALAVAVFLWGIVEFIAGADNLEKRESGEKHIIWGIVGLFIMVCVFGLMQVLANFWK